MKLWSVQAATAWALHSLTLAHKTGETVPQPGLTDAADHPKAHRNDALPLRVSVAEVVVSLLQIRRQRTSAADDERDAPMQ